MYNATGDSRRDDGERTKRQARRGFRNLRGSRANARLDLGKLASRVPSPQDLGRTSTMMQWVIAAAAVTAFVSLLPVKARQEVALSSLQPLATVVAAALLADTIKRKLRAFPSAYEIELTYEDLVKPSIWSGKQVVRSNLKEIRIIKKRQPRSFPH